mgnify:CR=1 FL=1
MRAADVDLRGRAGDRQALRASLGIISSKIFLPMSLKALLRSRLILMKKAFFMSARNFSRIVRRDGLGEGRGL